MNYYRHEKWNKRLITSRSRTQTRTWLYVSIIRLIVSLVHYFSWFFFFFSFACQRIRDSNCFALTPNGTPINLIELGWNFALRRRVALNVDTDGSGGGSADDSQISFLHARL